MSDDFTRVAIVNRGEPALRFIRGVADYNRRRGTSISTIALFSTADRRASYVREADEAVDLDALAQQEGRATGRRSPYTDYAVLERALRASRADAVWAGWGFVSEEPEFVDLCDRLAVTVIGPPARAMRLLGDKVSAKRLAAEVGVPVIPWAGSVATTLEAARAQAQQLGYPVVIKPSGGSGGRAIHKVVTAEELGPAFASAGDEARKLFADPTLFVERWLEGARHVEVQVVADAHGALWPLALRDCTVQRRHQKLVVEAPPPALPDGIEAALSAAAVRLCQAAGYRSTGTVEFLVEPTGGRLSFMEVNPRMQVEHAATEMTTGIDLVDLQLHIARGGRLEGAPPATRGHAIEVRLNAEDADQGFAAAPGTLRHLRVPTRQGLRLDAGLREGDAILPEYDSMFAKLVAHGATREDARTRLARALADSTVVIEGGVSTRAFLQQLVEREAFATSRIDVDWLDRLTARGEHLSRAHADVALLAAAIDCYEAAFAAERDDFFASAARLRPLVDPRVGRDVELRHRGQVYAMKVFRLGRAHYRVDVDGGRVDVRVDPLGAHERLIDYDGRRLRVVSTVQGLVHLVEIEGTLHRVSRDDAGLVRAFAPAIVVEVSAAAGDRVEAGQRLAMLEAMKMETPALAPCAGTVREVLVLQNAQVGAGTPLVRIDPEAEAEPDAAAERVRFTSAPAVPVAGGRPASRARAVLAGIRAFAQAMAPPELGQAEAVLGELRDLVLGSDFDAADARRVVDDYRHLLDRLPPVSRPLVAAEDEVLGIFADVASLFRTQPAGDDANEASALSSGQYFLTYLRLLDGRGEGLPAPFVAQLQRALWHYGSDSLDVTPELRSRLLWLYKAHQRSDQQVTAIMAILERRLRRANDLGGRADGAFLEVLDRLVAASDGVYPALADLARDVRYRYFEQPLLDERRQAIYADMEAHLTALMRSPAMPRAEHDERIRALVECPVPLGDLLAGHFEDAAPVLRQVMLEVLTRRYYRIRSLERVESREVGSRSLAIAEYDFEGRRVRLVATHATWSGLARVFEDLLPYPAAGSAAGEIVLDLYTWRPDEVVADKVVAEVEALLAGTSLPAAVARVMVAVAGPQAEWATSGTRYFTFRRADGAFREDRSSRGLHPMMAKRLELSRLRNFDIDRLPSAEDVYLFRAVARENPKDERLYAIAEVRDASAIRDASGRLLEMPHLERMLLEALAAIREVQFRRGPDERLHWNRVALYVWPAVEASPDELVGLVRRLASQIDGLGLEKIAVRLRLGASAGTEPRETVLSVANPAGHGLVFSFDDPADRPLLPLDEYTQKVVRMRQRGLTYPYEVVRMLTPSRERTASDLPPGDFQEYDLDAGQRLVPVERAPGRNTANVVVGVIRSYTPKHPEGLTRVVVLGDPSREVGSVAEPECRRILGGLDLAESMGVPFEWFALSAGAKISMESGTENMDWIGRVLRRLIEFTQAGREVNVVVTGINVGAQPYWNAEATMLMHTRGILVMMPESAMVLTGKTALDYSGSVSAEDNLGIGGYERIMGPNGQAQYWARDLNEACRILLRHYDHSYVVPGEAAPRRARTVDPFDRDVRDFPHAAVEGADFRLVGDVFSDTANPGRKRPFDIRSVMLSVTDQDQQPLERWAGMRDAEIAVVWDAHIGGYPVCLLGLESRTLARLGFVPTDGPDHWTSGTLFPMSSKKVARAINAATANRPLVILANLAGFDGSPESMRRRQLEFGAEIGRAVVNFKGPIVFVVVSRYHGGAFVVFSRTLNDNMQVAALEGTYASVIGGAPAAAVVFAREVDARTRKDARVVALEQELAGADDDARRRLRPRLAALVKSVRSEKLGEVADAFDRIHSVQRALKVGSLDTILPAGRLRPYLIDAIEAGLAREQARRGREGA